MTTYVCPHIPAAPWDGPCTIRGDRVVCPPCAAVLTYDGRRAWLESPECVEDCEPGATFCTMKAPSCANTCDKPIELDGYCLECWPRCHLVQCRHCDDYMPQKEAEEFDQKCSYHRGLPYTSYERGPQ